MSLSEMEKQKAAEAYGQVMDIIHRFEGGRSRHLTSEEVKNELLTMLQGISIINFEFTGLHNIVRGRVLDEGAAPFSNLQELTARRHEDVKGYGRCNRPGVSALYASNNLTTALSELRAHMGQRIQFIEASMKPEAKIGMLCVGIVDYCRRHRIPPPILGSAVKEHILGHQKIAGEANWPRVELIDAFIAQQFRKQVTRDYDYKKNIKDRHKYLIVI